MNKKFVIGRVFEKLNPEKIRMKANDFPTEYSPEYSIPLLTAGIENQGFARYARRSDCHEIYNNVLSVSANGANSGVVFYQPHDFAVLQDAYAIKVRNHKIADEAEGLYLAGALNKAVKENHDWVNKAGWNHIKTDEFELPVITDPAGQPVIDPSHTYSDKGYIPDWQYMHDRITELEHDRITELDAYLKATGLDDYELTDEDKRILSLSERSASDEDQAMESDSGIRWKKFKIGELFAQLRGKEAAPNRVPNGEINMVNETSTNNGITKKASSKYIFPANTITVSVNYATTVFYQSEPYCASVNILILQNPNLTPESGAYIVALLRKNNVKYDYTHKISKDKLSNTILSLPVTPSGEPDWSYMEKYIRTIEKTVIADVVKYKDQMIEKTKEVVGAA